MYTGIAIDPEKRFQEHISGKGAKYTKSHKPIKLIYTEIQPDRASALRREAEIKSMPRQQKIDMIAKF